MQELVVKFGVPPIGLVDLLHRREPLNIAFLPREFQPAGETFDDRWVFVGPSLAPRPETEALPLEHLEGGPVAYVSLGTVYNERPDFFRTVLRAFGGTGWRVVVATGKWVETGDLGRYRTTSSSGPGCPSSRCSRQRMSSSVTGG
jgi:MGT family glycosyltransferase